MKLNYKVIVTGGNGRFGSILKSTYKSRKLFYPNKKELDILSLKSIEKYLRKIKPKILIHLAGLSRPMKFHDNNINKSIDLNIIGTSNIVKCCSKLKIKLVYFSTSYVYPGKKGGYKEISPILPINNYAWSKLGGECAVHLYKNSLILRVCMTEKPFIHKKAFNDFKTNFIFQEEVAKILFKVLSLKGILNIGGKPQSPYKFVKETNTNIKPISRKHDRLFKLFPDTSMSIKKLENYLKKNLKYKLDAKKIIY
jgi:dTDP-4-dehydrorhamnose reductase